MGMILHSVFVLLRVLTSILQVQTQEQSAFISIDCGLPENATYTEKSTGINYISDAKFISTGVSKSVSPEDKRTHQQQFSYLRSFPGGVMRNCYRIDVTSGTKYLIRASFLYGNYDGLNGLPQFDLYLGTSLWDTVIFKNASLSIDNELIHSPSQDYIHLCLVNTGNGIPFISAIELRTLPNDIYVTRPPTPMARLFRLDFGSMTDKTYRYKDDLYDRLWEPYSDSQWTQLSRTLNSDYQADPYKAPAVVMNTAVTPINASASLNFSWDPASQDDKFYFFMHFTELVANETRSFHINLDGQPWGEVDTVSPKYGYIRTESSSGAWDRHDTYQLSLVRAESSTLPPIISALEVYLVKDFSQLETEKNDVDAVTNAKIAYKVTRNWQGDPCAPRAYKWDGLDCSVNGTPRIISLNLSSSGLTGPISPYISKLTMLESLDLSDNSLSGEVPYFLTQLQSLQVLYLGNNSLTGLVPSALLQRSSDGKLSFSFGGNPNLYTSTPRQKRNKVAILRVVTPVGFFILLAAALIFFRSKLKGIMSMNKLSCTNKIESRVDSNKKRFTYSEIQSITDDFKTVVGKGEFGTVYYGRIGETQVAVKMLSPSTQGDEQFHTESEVLVRVHHKCLTPLIGYCDEDTKRALIYKYMTNGNLAEHLSGKSQNFLRWEQRLQIALDSAKGLNYLHSDCQPPIVHRDVKPTNILLNEQFHGKISDFGLSRIFPNENATHVSTIIAGTPGYVDPEYNRTSRLTDKSDVYSFGLVLLEIITGRKAVSRTPEEPHIIEWVNSMLADEGEIDRIMDPRLQGGYDVDTARKVIKVAISCSAPSPINRPTMNQVVLQLNECLSMENLRSPSNVLSAVTSVGPAISGESSLAR